MKNIPLVSVGIGTYNHKQFIGECIDSVLAQDYENIEIVIADDGSIDGTREILQEYRRKNPHKITLLLSPNNQGITKNANLAHFNCKGKYAALIDGDDIILPEKIKIQVAYMEAHPKCTISYHNCEIFESDTGKILGYCHNHSYAPQGDIGTLLIHGLFNGSPSSMARREKTPGNGFDEKILYSPDWLYWIETLVNGGEIRYINKIMGRYRRHKGNITVTKPTLFMLWEKLLTVLIVTRKHPYVIKYYPAMVKDIIIRLMHNFFYRQKGMVLIKGKSLLRAYETPE